MDNKEVKEKEENLESTSIGNKIKKIFNKKRVSALIRLGLYIVFFLLIILMLNQDKKNLNNISVEDALTKYGKYNNYEAIYNIMKKNGEEETNLYIEVKRYIDKYIVTINDEKTYFIDETVYEYDETTQEFNQIIKDFDDLYNINPNELLFLINSGELVTESKIINTEMTKKKYLIDETNNYYISTYEENDIIVEVLIEYKNNEYSYEIDIDYSNIGKVENFDKK